MCVFVLKCPLKCKQAKCELNMKMRGKQNGLATMTVDRKKNMNNHIKYGCNEAIEDEANPVFAP